MIYAVFFIKDSKNNCLIIGKRFFLFMCNCYVITIEMSIEMNVHITMESESVLLTCICVIGLTRVCGHHH